MCQFEELPDIVIKDVVERFWNSTNTHANKKKV